VKEEGTLKAIVKSAATVVVLVLLTVLRGNSTMPAIHISPVDYSFEILNSDYKAGYVKLGFTFSLYRADFSPCGTLDVNCVTPNGVRASGITHWLVSFDSSKTYHGEVDLHLLSADTAEVDFAWRCTKSGSTGKIRYFLAKVVDSIQTWKGDPRGSYSGGKFPKPPAPEVDFDTLSEHDWSSEYEVYIDVRAPENLMKAQKILQQKLAIEKNGTAKVKTSLRKLKELADNGLDFEFVVPPPWRHRENDPG
jgi:hypothetical protein